MTDVEHTRTEERLKELLNITQQLSTEKNIDTLLELILLKSRELTQADAGSLYVLEYTEEDEKKLRFKLSQNESTTLPDADFFIDISNQSVAGSAALNGKPISIDDVYHMPPDLGYKHNREVDEKLGYETHSLLTAPMINHHNEVIGVIQLINKKNENKAVLKESSDYREYVIPFSLADQEILLSLASQAAIALENAQLLQDIRRMFDGIVDASVHAIEQRDPTTSGHSRRVSTLTCDLARIVDRVDDGKFEKVHFNNRDLEELNIASLLHDFGKIGVRETVLLKRNKLPDLNLELIETRIDNVLHLEKNRFLEKKIAMINEDEKLAEINELEKEWEAFAEKLNFYKNVIRRADKPTILPAGDFQIIDEISTISFMDEYDQKIRLLTEEERECLKIRKGTLSSEEMEEIQSHALKTYEFLQRIPWGNRFRNLPYIAATHHEKLNGSGYPWKLKEEEIPVQSKIMAISDIFDALTASDRPYKKAVPVTRALDILNFEVKDCHLDSELVNLFIDQKIYTSVVPAD